MDQPTQGEGNNQKILVSVIGLASGVLANLIAAIYLQMFSRTINSLSEFHKKLVATNHLHFSNFLLTKISDKNERNDVLATLAILIASGPAEDALEAQRRPSATKVPRSSIETAPRAQKKGRET